MAKESDTLRGSQSSLRTLGVVSGYLFKVVRESLGLTQATLAERLRIDVTTVQGWETGRRSLSAMRGGDLVTLSMKLVKLGASPTIIPVLSDALEADLVIATAVAAGARVIPADQHPLAAWVHRRDLTNLITWPLTG